MLEISLMNTPIYRKENITIRDKTELLIESIVLVFLVFALA